MKYIDAEKLITEIKRYKNKADERLKIKGRTFSEEQKDLALQNLCGNLLYFITSLQQEQSEIDGDDGKFVKISVRKEFAEQFQKLGDKIQAGQSSFVKAMNQQEQPELPGIEDPGIPGKDFIPVEWVDACEMYGKWKIVKQEQPEGLHFTPLNRLIQKIPSKKWNDTVNNYAKKVRDCLIKEGYLKDARVLQDYISYMNGNNVPMATMDEQEQPEVDLEKEIDHYLYGENSVRKYDGVYVPGARMRDWKNPNVGKTLYGNELTQFARHFYELGLKARKEE